MANLPIPPPAPMNDLQRALMALTMCVDRVGVSANDPLIDRIQS